MAGEARVVVAGAHRVVAGVQVLCDIAECGSFSIEVGTTGPSRDGAFQAATYIGFTLPVSVKGRVEQMEDGGANVEVQGAGDDFCLAAAAALKLAAEVLERRIRQADVDNAMRGAKV